MCKYCEYVYRNHTAYSQAMDNEKLNADFVKGLIDWTIKMRELLLEMERPNDYQATKLVTEFDAFMRVELKAVN